MVQVCLFVNVQLFSKQQCGGWVIVARGHEMGRGWFVETGRGVPSSVLGEICGEIILFVLCGLDTDLSTWHCCKVCMRHSNTFLRNAYPKLGRPQLPAVPRKASDCLLTLPPPLSQIGLIYRLYSSRILLHHHRINLLWWIRIFKYEEPRCVVQQWIWLCYCYIIHGWIRYTLTAAV